MSRSAPAVLAACALALALAACTHTAGGIAASSHPLAPGSYTELGPVRGHDCAVRLFGLLPLTGGNETRRALEDALDERPDTHALIRVTSDTYHQWWLVVTSTCTEVHGTAVSVP